MVTPKVANRYPRSGERVAPFTLKDVLSKPITRRLREQIGDAYLKLCDLDESVWQTIPADQIGLLAAAVVDCVSMYQSLKAIHNRRFPRPQKGIRLDDLRLENRTRRCLIREGLDDRLEQLGDYTLGEILSIKAFGPRCLLDLLAALESSRNITYGGKSIGAKSSKISAELSAEVEKLASLPESRSVCRDDPRFAQCINAISSEARTAYELAEELRSHAKESFEAFFVLEQLHELLSIIEQMSKLTIEEELIQIFAAPPSTRNREILIGYYGWEEGQTHTLTEIGDKFGITRERVRQICAKQTKKLLKATTILSPVMDRALSLIEERIPTAAAALEAELVEKKLTAVGMTIEAVTAGAKLLRRPVNFKLVKIDEEQSAIGRRINNKPKTKNAARKEPKKHPQKDWMVVRPDQVEAVPAISDQAKKEIYFHGLTTVGRIEKTIAQRFPQATDGELVKQTLMQIDGFRWLDESAGWFTLRGIAKHGLPKSVDKVLAVGGKTTVRMMRTALGRNHRLWKDPPPEKILLEYCRLMPNVKVEGNRIWSDPPRNWKKVLKGVEAKLVSVLKKHGPLMDRGAMEDLCVAAGMNRFSFHAFVSWSPVIEQFGHSLYGLLGAEVTKEQINKMLTRRRATRTSHRVLDDHGIAEDGKVWLRYHLSKAASTYAVITIPADLKKIVRGRFKLFDPKGRGIGTLATKEGRAWGLGAHLRECGAKFGDQVTLNIDLPKRAVTVIWESGKG